MIVTARRPIADRAGRIFEWFAIAVAVGAGLIMMGVEGLAGLVQRFMFVVAYVWFAGEAIHAARSDPHSSEAVARRMQAEAAPASVDA